LEIIEKCLYNLCLFVDFLLCMFIFPDSIKCMRVFRFNGQNTIAEKIFFYEISKNISVKGDILEIGSFMGSSGLLLAAGNDISKRKSDLWLIEPNPRPTKEVFLDIFKKLGLASNTHLINKTSENARKDLDKRFRFIFIDGLHSYEYVKKDIDLWKDLLNPGGLIAFHDYTSPGVSTAIEEMINKPAQFTACGTISGIWYAVKGTPADINLLSALKKLHSIRNAFISVGKGLKLKK